MDLETVPAQRKMDDLVYGARVGPAEYLFAFREPSGRIRLELCPTEEDQGQAEGVLIASEVVAALPEDGENSGLGEIDEPEWNPDSGKDAIGAQSRRRKQGRRRLPRSIGRFPFTVTAGRYLDALRPYRAEITLRQLQWDLATIDEDLRSLRSSGKVTTTNPAKMSVDDLAILIGHWKTRPRRGKGREGGRLDPTSQAHLFKALKGLLEFCGNPAIGQLKTRPYVQLPKPLEKPVLVLSETELARLRAAAETMPGWWGSVARFLVTFAPETGLRVKELRLQELACVDLTNRLVLVCHPKGENRWAAPHTEYAPIGEAAVQPFLDFVQEREAFLDGEAHEALLPFRHDDGRLDFWPPAMLGKLKARIEERSGVGFQVRTFRATFGQRAKDAGASIESVSRAMRHKTTATTEKYYSRVRPDRALAEVRAALAADYGQKSI